MQNTNQIIEKIFEESYIKLNKQLSTVLFKNRRYKILERKRIRNLLHHLFRNFKEETRQRKKDFDETLTKNNLIISYTREDNTYKAKTISCGDNWFDEVQSLTDQFNALIQDNIDLVSKEYEESSQGLSKQDRDNTAKSLKYLNNVKDNQLNAVETEIISRFRDNYKQFEEDNKETAYGQIKDYKAFDLSIINELNDYYENVEDKIKSFGAKKKHIAVLLKNLEKMNESKEMDVTKSLSSVAIEERLFKIPKHNHKSLDDKIVREILEQWHLMHFKDFDILKTFIHKDERTKKDNPEDDHIHMIISGFNRKTRRYDLPDYTYQLMKEIAKKRGFPLNCDKKWNKASQENQLLAGEAYQLEFYDFANSILEKNKIDFRFGILAKNEENKFIRDKIKADVDAPNKSKSERWGNYENLLRDEFKAKFEALDAAYKEVAKENKEKIAEEYKNKTNSEIELYKIKVDSEKKQINKEFNERNRKIKACLDLKEKELDKKDEEIKKLEGTINKLNAVIKGIIQRVFEDISIFDTPLNNDGIAYMKEKGEFIISHLRRVFTDHNATEFLTDIDKEELKRQELENKHKEKEAKAQQRALEELESNKEFNRKIENEKRIHIAKKCLNDLNIIFESKAGSTVKLSDNSKVKIPKGISKTRLDINLSENIDDVYDYINGKISLGSLILFATNDINHDAAIIREEEAMKSRNEKRGFLNKYKYKLKPDSKLDWNK
ncbi:coiled-coil domain-containing protein [Aliivibrio fischeri]|uniref:coiled-coil domain-containing protein n=1 Tax=Aliivibrio fischeri TaxID=668 RepID=UPI003F7604AD